MLWLWHHDLLPRHYASSLMHHIWIRISHGFPHHFLNVFPSILLKIISHLCPVIVMFFQYPSCPIHLWTHLDVIKAENNGHTDNWVIRQHKHRLTTWLIELDIPDGETIEDTTRQRFVAGLSSQVTSWQSYDINGYTYTYYTNTKDNNYVNQKSDTQIDVVDVAGRKTTYFGIIYDIWELDYGMVIQIALFRCC